MKQEEIHLGQLWALEKFNSVFDIQRKYCKYPMYLGNRLHSWSQTPAPGFIESDLWFIVCHSPFRSKQMLFVSNSPTPGTREILSAHLITIKQAVPIRTLYFQGLFLPRPEEVGFDCYTSDHSDCSQSWRSIPSLGFGRTACVESPSQAIRDWCRSPE